MPDKVGSVLRWVGAASTVCAVVAFLVDDGMWIAAGIASGNVHSALAGGMFGFLMVGMVCGAVLYLVGLNEDGGGDGKE